MKQAYLIHLEGDFYYQVVGDTFLVFDSETLELGYACVDAYLGKIQDGCTASVVSEFQTLVRETERPCYQTCGGQKSALVRLLLTSRCNMNCDYCQMRQGIGTEKWFGDMPMERLQNVLEKIAIMNLDYVTLHFSGGEPLIAFKQIQYASKLAREKFSAKVRLAMSTNGTLINPEIAQFIKDYQIQTVISIDGLGGFNKHRKDRGGNKTLSKVMHGYDLLNRIGVPVGLSLVVTSLNIDAIQQIVRELIDTFQPESLGLNYMHYPGFARDLLDAMADRDLDRYSSALFDAYKICKGKQVFEEQSFRIIEPFVTKKPRKHYCSSQFSQITVGPSGSISPCKTFLVGGYYTIGYDAWIKMDDPLNHLEFQECRSRVPSQIAECATCYVRNLCGAGCSYEAYVDNETLLAPNRRHCVVPRHFLQQMMLELHHDGAFDDSGSSLRLLGDEKRRQLLAVPVSDQMGLTCSIGHMLE